MTKLISRRQAIQTAGAAAGAFSIAKPSILLGQGAMPRVTYVTLATGFNVILNEYMAAKRFDLKHGVNIDVINSYVSVTNYYNDFTAGTFELWVAGQGQGAGWMRQKAATSEAPPPASPGGPAATAAQADANVPTNTFNTAAANNANVGVATPGGANNARGQTATLLQPAMASGLRIVVARADGTSLIRVFMIGGGA